MVLKGRRPVLLAGLVVMVLLQIWTLYPRTYRSNDVHGKRLVHFEEDMEIVYLRIHKTGGTSLTHWFAKECEKRARMCKGLKRFEMPYQTMWHWDFETISKIYNVEEENVLLFSTFRDPETRIVSEYFMCTGHQASLCRQKQWGYTETFLRQIKGLKLDEFVQSENNPANNRQVRMLTNTHQIPFDPLWSRTFSKPGKWAERGDRLRRSSLQTRSNPALTRSDLEIAKERVKHMFGLGITEDLATTIELWCNQLRWGGCETLTKSERRPTTPFNFSSTLELRALIRERNALDVELYEFVREEYERRLKRYGLGESKSREVIIVTVAKITPWVLEYVKKMSHDVNGKGFRITVLCDARNKMNSTQMSINLAEGVDIAWASRSELEQEYGKSTYETFTLPYHSPDKIGALSLAYQRLGMFVGFWFVEIDVVMNGNWLHFFQAYRGTEVDMMFPRVNDVNDAWKWWRQDTCKHPVCTDKNKRKMVFWPLARFSPNAIRLLHNTLKQERNVAMSEAFVGSMCSLDENCKVGQFPLKWLDGRPSMEGGTFRVAKREEDGKLKMSWPNVIYHPIKEEYPTIQTEAIDSSWYETRFGLVPLWNLGRSIHISMDSGKCFKDLGSGLTHCLPRYLYMLAVKPDAISQFIPDTLVPSQSGDVRNFFGQTRFFDCLQGSPFTRPMKTVSCLGNGSNKMSRAHDDCPHTLPWGPTSDVRSSWQHYVRLWSENRESNVDVYGGNFDEVMPKDVVTIMPSIQVVFVFGDPISWIFHEWEHRCKVVFRCHECSKHEFEKQVQYELGKYNNKNVAHGSLRRLLAQASYITTLRKWLADTELDSIQVRLIDQPRPVFIPQLECYFSTHIQQFLKFLENEPRIVVQGKWSDKPKPCETSCRNWQQTLLERYDALSHVRNILDRLERPECKAYYSSSCLMDPVRVETFFDGDNFVYRSRGDKADNFSRILTREDTAKFPKRSSDDTAGLSLPKDTWDVPVFVQTMNRAVFAVTDANPIRRMYIPIWKAASTEITDLLQSTAGWIGPHEKTPKSWAPEDPRNRCERFSRDDRSTVLTRLDAKPSDNCIEDGTFRLNTQMSEEKPYMFTVVRDPVDRLISGIYPHRPWKQSDFCFGGKPCQATMNNIRSHIRMLRDEMPLSINISRDRIGRRLPHWLTQMYFISATDLKGNPLKFSDIIRLEDGPLDQSLGPLFPHLGIEPTGLRTKRENSNSGGSSKLKKVLREAILNENDLACAICEIYAQDYVCLGYALPQACYKNRCVFKYS